MQVELFPELSFGVWNGWIASALICLVDGAMFLTYPKPVLSRVWDRFGWNRHQAAFTAIGKMFALVCLILLALSPLKIGEPVLCIGAALALLGLAGLVQALFAFRDTPLGEPVERGVYRISRHPQIVMSSAVLLGACIAVGSWTALAVFAAARFFSHWGIIAEEEICLKRFGESYRRYLQRVPRYFLIF